jgi:glucosylceramidase
MSNFMSRCTPFLAACCASVPLLAQQSANQGQVRFYTTATNTEYRLAHTDTKQFVRSEQPLETDICVFLNPRSTFQTLLGIGGALTDASADVFAQLPAGRQQELLTAYYDPEKGIGYTLARTCIHSSDFSAESYTYVNEGDKELKTFSIDHDRKHRIPLIKRAIQAAGGKLTLYASPWSPPAFMKDNHNMCRGGRLLPECYASWALYMAKFIKAYEAEGIPIWGITVQNEPMATQKWESCIYTAEEERDFLKRNLGPTLAREGLADKKIVVWDHNRDLINHRLDTIYGDPEAAKYAWGAGFHWYETWTGGQPMHENVRFAHESYPDKKLMFTEGCVENFDSNGYQRWSNAERYGSSMINDFNSGAVGWTDWNILLDQHGGPNHAGNFCFAPVHADTSTGELIYTPAYYYIGHFSKFIRPGARRIAANASRSQLQCTAFVNPGGSIVTVVLNLSDTPVKYKLVTGRNCVEESIPARGIQTAVF